MRHVGADTPLILVLAGFKHSSICGVEHAPEQIFPRLKLPKAPHTWYTL